jgi:hypothetical protein
MEGQMVVKEPQQLPPVQRRAVWIAWGVALQAVGVGLPVTAALRRANKDGVLGSLTRYTVRLVWHEMLRSRADIALIVLGVIVFAAGSVVLARPFVWRRSTLFVAVPVFAAAGVVVLGVVALVIAVVFAAVEGASDVDWSQLLDGLSGWAPVGRRNRRK